MGSEIQGYIVIPCWNDGGTIKVLVNDSGNLRVAEQSPLTELDVTIKASDITVPVAEQSPLTSIQSQGYGWDLSSWRKLPLTFGYSDNFCAAVTIANAAAGYNALTIVTIPSGYVYVVEYVNAVDVNNAPTRILIDAVIDGNSIIILDDNTPVANQYSYTQVKLTLKATDYLRVRYWGCTVNDDLWGKASGYVMKVNE